MDINFDGFRSSVYHYMCGIYTNNPSRASDAADQILACLALNIKH